MTVPVLRCSVSRCIVPGTGDPSDSIVRQLAVFQARRLFCACPDPKTAPHFSGHARSPLLFCRRGGARRVRSLRPLERARGTPDARCVRSLVCESGEAHEHSHHGRAGGIRRSARGGVMACFASPPVSNAGTTVSRRHGLPRQDHATWAIRRSVVVRRVTRAPSAGLRRP